jgi:putative 3-deoxy-D-arabino-heptulosonate 7-phosphate synthase
MRYFLKNNEVYAYDDEQIAQGYGEGLQEITEEELKEKLSPSIEQLKEGKTTALNDWYKNMTENFKVDIKDFGVVEGGYKALVQIQAIIDTSDDLAVRAYPLADGKMAKVKGVEDIKKIKKAIQRAFTGLGALKIVYEAKINKAKNGEDINKIVFADTVQETL